MEESKVIRLSKNTAQAIEDYRNAKINQWNTYGNEEVSKYYRSMSDSDIIGLVFRDIIEQIPKE